MSRFGRIAVVGASLAGLRAVEFLRRERFEGEILLIGDESHPPYDRPPLSKELLRGEWDEQRIALRKKSYDELEVELRLGRRVASLDTESRILRFDDGGVASFDGLVIATGGIAKKLSNQPELDGVFRDFRRTVDAYGDRVLLGETPEPDPALLGRFYGRRGDGLHLPFNFTLLDAPWEAPTLRRRLEDYYDALPAGATPNVVLGNHDCARLATRYGAANHRAAALLLLTLRGVPILYYGDELGMRNAPIPPERARDPWGLNNPDAGVGRDPARTPMQWDASPNAGFCPAEVEPWLPVAPEAHRVNVAVQRDDPASTLALYRRLLRLRRTWTALWEGRLDWVGQSPRDVLAYRREAGEQRLLVVINCGAEPQAWDASRLAPRAEVLLSTHAHPGGRVALEALALAPHQGLLLRLTGS